MATHGSGKVICNYANLTKQIVEDKYVVFNAMRDPESVEILKLLRACNLEKFCSAHANPVMQHEALEFLHHLEVLPNQDLKSMVNGESFEVTNDDLIRLFGFPKGKIRQFCTENRKMNKSEHNCSEKLIKIKLLGLLSPCSSTSTDSYSRSCRRRLWVSPSALVD